MSRTQRWTLAVVCAATAMLMLDIAVVNTALSAIAADLDTGLSGPAVGRRRLHAHRSPRPSSPPARSPTASAAAGCSRSASASSPPPRCCARRRSRSRCSTPRAPRRASAPRSCSRSRWPCSPTRSRACEERVKALAAYGATMGGSFAVGPLVGGALTSGARLALDLPHQPPARAAVPVDRPPLRRRVDGSARAARRPAGPRHAHGRPLPARVRAAARQRRWAGGARRSSPPSPAPPRCCARSSPSRRASRSRCSRCACSATRRSPARRSRRSGSPRRCSRCGST